MINQIIKFLKNASLTMKMCILLIILFLIIQVNKYLKKEIETFTIQNEKYKVYRNDDLYDDFYVSVYDKLLFNNFKNAFELKYIEQEISDIKNKSMLDIGSGTGHHCALFKSQGYTCQGLDISQAMINKAKENYPDIKFNLGDGLNTMLFDPNKFGLITMLYFTIYYIENKEQMFRNCFDWLDYGGYFVLHLVDQNLFDPMVPSSTSLTLVSLQDHAKERITKSNVVFNNFKYKSHLILEDSKNNGEFREKFIFNDNKIRINEHTLYFDTQKIILDIAKSVGFIVIKKLDMKKCLYDYQYLYVLQKPK